MIPRNLSVAAISSIQGVDYCCIIDKISKNENMGLSENVNLNEKCLT